MKHNIYFHQPKTGGHTIWSAIRGTQVTDIEKPECHVTDDVTWHKVHFGYPNRELIHQCNHSGGTFFISLRDPATHLVSFYNMIRMQHIEDPNKHVSSTPLLWDWSWEQNNLKRIIELELLEAVYSYGAARYRNILPFLYLQDIDDIQILNQETLDFDIQTKLGLEEFQSENVTAENAKKYDGFQVAKLDTLEDDLKTQLYKFLETDYYWYNLFQEAFK